MQRDNPGVVIEFPQIYQSIYNFYFIGFLLMIMRNYNIIVLAIKISILHLCARFVDAKCGY